MLSSPFSTLFDYLSSLISSLDKNLLALENSLQSLHLLDQIHQNSHSDQTSNKIKLLTSFLLEDKVTKLSKEIEKIAENNIKPGINKILSSVTQIISQSNQIYSLFPSSQNELISESSSENLFPNKKLTLQILGELSKNFQLQAHFNGFNKTNFHEFSRNMQFMETNKVRSKDLNAQKSEQKKLSDQLISLRQLLIQSNFQGEKFQTNEPKGCFKQIFGLYQKLFNLNRYQCIYQKIIYPIINFEENTQYLQKSKLNNENYENKILNLSITNSIQFKIEAQGFVSNQSAKLTSIRQIFDAIKKTNAIDHIEKDETSSNTKAIISELTNFQENLMNFYEKIEQKQQERYFQFGLIDTTCSDKFLNHGFFQNFQNSVKFLNKDSKFKEFAQLQFQDRNIEYSEKFSLKILHIENNFYIQSEKQAKLIKLDSKWEYFSLKVFQSQEKPFPSIQLYGLISTGNKKTKDENFQEQLILSCSISPSMNKKVLKPYFSFKNFQCKINIK